MNGSQKGIIGLLFDFGFTDFITKKLIKFLYVAGMLIAAFMAISVIGTGFAQGKGVGVVALILSPMFFLFFVALVRIQLELMMVVFRIADYARTVAEASDRPLPTENTSEGVLDTRGEFP